MPPKSELAHVTQLDSLQFLTAKSTHAVFAFEDSELQLEIEATAPGVYRLRCAPASVLNNDKPSARARAHAEMLLARQEPVSELAVSSIPGKQGWRLEQGDIALEIAVAPLQIGLYRGQECLARTGEPALQHGDVQADPAWRLCFELDADDSIYGLGETAGDLDRRGQSLASDSPQARALPLAWSPRGWGLYVNSLGRVEHDVAAHDPDLYELTSHAAVLDVFLFAGEPGEIVNQYTALTGRAGQPCLWPMGVWLDQAPGQSIDELHAAAQRMRADEFAFDAVRLGPPAAYGFQADKPVFEWNEGRVPDPRALLTRFQDIHLQVAAPSFPGVLAGTPLFDEWEDRGWLLADDSGGAYVFAGSEASGGKPFGLLDLTYKDVYKLWAERQRQVFDEGLGAPDCDAQFDIPDGVSARGGETGAQLRTIYPLLARQALFDAVAGHKTPQEGVIFSTDLFPGVQRYAWQAAPRVDNSWQGLAHTLRTALAVGNSGVTAQLHGVGCAHASTADMTPELYARWLAAAVFSANFSFQGLPQLLPQGFDEATRALVRHWLQWRYRLIPYVLGIIEDAVRTGLPVQRSMPLAFPADVMAHVWDTQYLLGPALLVAPVLQPGTQHKVYLPAGDAWWDLSTGQRYEGGSVLSVEVELDSLPVFGREGHMLCLGPAAQHTGEFNSARILDEVWMFGMPEHSPVVMRNKIRVMQMQGSSYIKGLEGLKILPSEGLEVKRRGAEVRISRVR
ncbi:glycoside hydrolase family 31 protein [Pusillimonas noertemannii]|uniref:Alpha-D-xyloside xylohydrolase n=2 Tax=Pusillimonas noertemannii TaxID=305977 RepID=A0A2U1CKM9_9BURK|nr:glycoside hydrolase family 31 protein [Pusillimonas noertemannii]NYT69085.1 glycoside hydrolase family 31 protein [Pusillimonas noertemannii]PVY61552.1 alpha-D-xyloside xylohydrolase [Pusillimonas noertemannii]TFL09501.1 glycoside hydrolase family 31 protein [Pusillimonas noertemannii]